MAEKKEETAKPKKEEKKEATPKKEEKKTTPSPKKEATPVTKSAEPVKESKKEESKADVKKEDKKKDSKKEEKEEKPKFLKESVHIIPLRKAFDYPRTKRTKYAIREIKRYIVKHTRKEPVIDAPVNELIWERGIKNSPRKLKVKIQEEEKRAIATLV